MPAFSTYNPAVPSTDYPANFNAMTAELDVRLPSFPLPLSAGGIGAASAAAGLANLGGAPLASPTLTGTPAAPTAAADISTTQLATTAFVLGQSATQGEQEAASSLTKYVSPGRQRYHPAAAKAWVKWQDNGTVNAAYGVSSITDNGVGDHTVNFNFSFSSVQYGITTAATDTGALCAVMPLSPQVSTCQFRTRNAAGAQTDVGGYYAAFYGDI